MYMTNYLHPYGMMITPIVLMFIAYLVGVAAMKILEKSLLFQPTTIKKNQTIALPSDAMEIMIYNQLHAIFMAKSSDYLIIVAHGNAGNVQMWTPIIQPLGKLGSVLLFDYSGYGKSKGGPSEQQLYKDIRMVWKYAIQVLQYPPDRIILHGFSLGCSPVLWLGQYFAKKRKPLPLLIICQSGFSSFKNIAREHIPYGASYFINSQFDNMKYAQRIRGQVPILVIHSPEDEIIKIDHAIKLLLAHKNMHFFRIKGTHNDPQMDDHYIDVIGQFVRNIRLVG